MKVHANQASSRLEIGAQSSLRDECTSYAFAYICIASRFIATLSKYHVYCMWYVKRLSSFESSVSKTNVV